jgi:ethanolamine utilization microcompartment shell protein EutS
MSQDVIIHTSLAHEALFVAQTQIHVFELPHNRGPAVARYLKSVGLGEGYPWCAAFVYWCVDVAARRLNLPNPLVKTAGVLEQWNHTTLRKLPPRATNIEPGDLFVMDFGAGRGHMGFVEQFSGTLLTTIEGNSNEGGSREGVEVVRRQRALSEINKGFIKLN